MSKPFCHTRTKTVSGVKVSADDIYLMVCLHRYQRMSCEKIARRFGLPQGRVRDIIARNGYGGCCG